MTLTKTMFGRPCRGAVLATRTSAADDTLLTASLVV